MLPTETKIGLARLLNRIVVGARSLVGLGPCVRVSRHGVAWALDLNEGIDLAIYLNVYQSVPRRMRAHLAQPGAVALDIGANIGSHSLPLARCVGPFGRVIAIEPTGYAFSKLVANAGLNPDLAERLILVQAALTAGPAEGASRHFYSRWPLRDQDPSRHARHRGRLQSAAGARFVALDTLLAELRAAGRVNGPVSFVKLDVDGHELEVLRGGAQTFSQDRPLLLMEIAPFVQDDVAHRFEALIETLRGFSYRLEEGASGKPLPLSAEELRRIIPEGAGMDAAGWPA